MQTTNPTAVRRLKIEEHGDAWQGVLKPKIRLIGRWLEQAGFKPGGQVQVHCVAPGILELRSAPANSEATQPSRTPP